MSAARRAPGIRVQLLWLFGLLLATGAIVIVLDEYRQRAEIAALTHLHDDALAGLRATKAVSDAYGLDVVDTAFRVRNYLLGWEQGVAVLDRAQASIAAAWTQLERSSMPPEQRALLEEIARARGDADRASARLRAILQAQDIHALGRFADTELYPAIDPVTTRLNFLADLKMQEAGQLLAAQTAAARLVGAHALAGAAEAIEHAARGEGVTAARRLTEDAHAALDALRAWSASAA
ncbi:signal transduction four helix bundle sensory module [Mizugakiibacter sediminis]|uniref:Signal transduction four helix bundle sensory module n=1 Tax=Mizugakiibacter sediminis TaxID=1475481 RepID=A0A0K8QRB5_9GAMM|nr:signal transduction four helix bundle sensory module [Mizugakiibacter sediminis]